MKDAKIIPLPAGQMAKSPEARVLEKTEEVCRSFVAMVQEACDKIRGAEREAIARLETFVPTEPLMTAEQVTAYLGFRDPRTIHSWTKPGLEPVIPYVLIGGEKRFRKSQIDRELERKTIQKRRVRL